jgi:hypothetical protein
MLFQLLLNGLLDGVHGALPRVLVELQFTVTWLLICPLLGPVTEAVGDGVTAHTEPDALRTTTLPVAGSMVTEAVPDKLSREVLMLSMVSV